VNAIPYVCDAKPGILSTADLPPIVPHTAPATSMTTFPIARPSAT
jgi:hypothetical protein